jgi:uncharacterized tellurite resistance protein B-like protein
MSRITDYLRLIDDPRQPGLQPGHPSDPALLSLLVHLAAEDGVVGGDEFALLQRVRADLAPGELLQWASDEAREPLDLQGLTAAVTSEEDRWNVLRFAARVVAVDGDLAVVEVGMLDQVAHHLGLPDGAARQVLDEVIATGGPVSEEQLRDALRNMWWDVLQPRHEALSGPLARVVPAQSTPLCSVLLQGPLDEEVAGLYLEGLAAQFDSGPAFVGWAEIRHYTRVPVPGAAFHVRTTSGRHLSMTPPRLRDLGALVDHVYGRRPARR